MPVESSCTLKCLWRWGCKFAQIMMGKDLYLCAQGSCLLANLPGWVLRVCFQKQHENFVFKFAFCECSICIWKQTLKLSQVYYRALLNCVV